MKRKYMDSIGEDLHSLRHARIVFIMHMPPPIHGASMVGQAIHDSKCINGFFDALFFNLSSSESIDDIGKIRFGKICCYIKLLWGVYKVIRKYHPHLVYVTPNTAGLSFYKDFLLVQMLKRMKCNVIVHFHNKGVLSRQNRIIDNWLYEKFFKDIKVILLAKSLYNDIKKYVKTTSIYICPNGIKDESLGLIPKRNSPVTRILFLSNMLKEKGVLDLLDACKLLHEKGILFECTFVGAESVDINAVVFDRMVADRGLSTSVQYIGKKYGDEKRACYMNSDLFVFPTFYHNECFPIVLLEAMSFGLPCISTNEGAISEIIDDGVTGFVVDKNDVHQLADKIELLIKNPTLLRDMGMAGKVKFQEKYSLEKFEATLINILQQEV